MTDNDYRENHGQGQRGDHNGRDIMITMLPGNAGWRIYYGDQAGGRYVNIGSYEAIKDYVLDRKPRHELLDIYPELRGNHGPT